MNNVLPRLRYLRRVSVGVRECIFLGMQKIFAQICFSQITYTQQALMFTLKFTAPFKINQSVCIPKHRSPNISNKLIHV